MANLQQNEEQNRSLSNEEKDSIRQEAVDYRKAKSISQADMALQIDGMSGATLNHMENGKWENIKDSMWRLLKSFISSRQGNDVLQTSDYITLSNTMKLARQRHFMIGVTADTGMGKTTSLKTFAFHKNVFYIVANKSMKPRQFFVALLKEMGISYDSNIHDLVNRIAEELNALHNPLLLIDEAGKISQTMILYLHELRDKTAQNAGIVLAGMPYFRNNLEKLAGKQKEGCAEFLRRINLWENLKGLRRKEIEQICEANGITDAEILREMYGKKRFGDLENAILFHNLSINPNDANDN